MAEELTVAVRRIPFRAQERGFVTITSMFALIVIMGLMLSHLYGSLSARQSITLHETRAHALELAEMALIQAEMEFRGQNDLDGNGVGIVIGQLDPGDMLSGTYQVDAAPVSGQPSLHKLTAIGTKGHSTRKLEVGLLVSKPYEFSEAIAATGNLVMRGAVRTDAYDSRLGAWATQAVNSDAAGAYANTGGHVVANLDVDVHDTVTVRGDAPSGPGHTTDVHGLNATVTGDMGAMSTAIAYPTPSLLEFEHAAENNKNDEMQLLLGATYDSVNKNLSATSSGTVTLSAGTYFFNDFTFDGTSQLILNGPVRIYVTGELRFASAAQVTYGYVNYDPRGLRLIAHPYAITPSYVAPIGRIQLNSSLVASLTLYAPARDVLVGSTANIAGAIVGNDVEFDTSAQIHYDVALGVPGSGIAETAVFYWRDLNPPSY